MIPIQTKPTRLWFLNQGCHQVPLKHSKNKVRWGHPDGYFLNAIGVKMSLRHTPSKPSLKNGKSHSDYPKIDDNKLCHIFMAIAFYGERPTFIDEKTGKPYGANCHHLIPDKLNYRPANLLCWLTRLEHRIADRRQRALKTVVPDGDLHLFSYERLRELQDPRVTSDEQFQRELDLLRKDGFHRDPRSSDEIMLHEMTHHMEV